MTQVCSRTTNIAIWHIYVLGLGPHTLFVDMRKLGLTSEYPLQPSFSNLVCVKGRQDGTGCVKWLINVGTQLGRLLFTVWGRVDNEQKCWKTGWTMWSWGSTAHAGTQSWLLLTVWSFVKHRWCSTSKAHTTAEFKSLLCSCISHLWAWGWYRWQNHLRWIHKLFMSCFFLSVTHDHDSCPSHLFQSQSALASFFGRVTLSSLVIC